MSNLYICGVLLTATDSDKFIAVLFAILGFVGLPLLVRFTQKWSGTTTVVVGKTRNKQAALQAAKRETAVYEKQLIEKMKMMNPDIVKQAQKNIAGSIYANTIQNVYDEAVKLNRIKKIKENLKLL